jgi:uncharacterized protein (DUF305 family)
VLTKQLVILSFCSSVAAAQTASDVAFMQGMILHHGQALTMARLIPGRTSRKDFALMGERIVVSQTDEIAWMTRWLKAHHASVPMLDHDAHAMHDDHMAGHDADSAMHHATMPGMLAPEELAQLGKTNGPEFEQLFLKSMIKHHEGALKMVSDLRARGGGKDATMDRFASEIDADQSAEIARMQTLLQPTP